MLSAFDPYPTRLPERARPVPRREPVVHGSGRGPLTARQLSRFERDGFLVLDGFLQPHELRPFIGDLEAMQQDRELERHPGVIREPDGTAIRSVFGIHGLSHRFDALVRDDRLLGLARQILGGDVYIHQSRINRKPAFTGRGFDWHSDFETWHAEDGMPAMRCLSVSVSLTDNHHLNGPLLLVPGSHRTFYPTVGATPDRNWDTSLQRQWVGVPERADLETATRTGGVTCARGGVGTVTVFDCNTLHASAENLSPDDRPNLFFVYNSAENRLTAPFAARQPRPEWLAARTRAEILQPVAHRQYQVA